MDRLMIKRWIVVLAVILVNIIVHIGIAGLVATGVYMLNSFFGLAADAKPWQYGIVGVIYLIVQVPLVTVELKNKWENYLRWGFLF